MSTEVTELKHKLTIYQGLVEASALIGAISEPKSLLAAIMNVARLVMEAEASSVFLAQGRSEQLDVSVALGPGGQIVEVPVPIPPGSGISGWVFQHNEPLIVADVYNDPRFYPEIDKLTGFTTRSIMCVPLHRNGKPVGVLQVLNPKHKLSFDAADLEGFTAYGHLAAAALEKLNALQQEKDQERLEQELRIATEMQRSFLPASLPQRSELQFAAYYRPALRIGGDFYDVMEMGDDEIFFAVGDVAGKGIPAALLMAQSLSLLRMILIPGVSLTSTMEKWNRMIGERIVSGMFVTALLGRITPSQRKVEFTNAGHCPPLVRSRNGKVVTVKREGSPPLGILPVNDYQSHEFTFEPGEMLIFYTDGLVESFDSSNVELGYAGVKSMIEKMPVNISPLDIVNNLAAGEAAHRQHTEPYDDLTLLVIGFSRHQ